MLQKVLVSRRAADCAAEVLMVGLTLAFLVKFSFVLLVPIGFAILAIPLALFVWLPTSKTTFGFPVVAVIVAVAAFTEVWAYLLFQLLHQANYGHSFSLPLS